MSSSNDWIVDASILVDLVIGGSSAGASREVLSGCHLHAPAHVDVEVTSALARLFRGKLLTKSAADRALTAFGQAPLTRHQLPGLVAGAWARSSGLRVADAFYVELAHQLGARVLTVDARLARASTYAVLPPGFGA